MQEKATIKRVLDTTRPNTSKPIFAVSGDYSVRKIRAIICADGEPIMVPATAAVVISAERPDGASDSFAGEANGDGNVTVPVTQWMIAVEGDVECSVSAITAEGKISTTYFYITVQKSPHVGEVSEDDPEYDLLALVLTNENVRQMNEEERKASEEKRESAENARDDAELIRSESEDSRVENESERVSAEKIRETKFNGWERDIGSLPSFDARITRNSKRISNLEAGLPDDTFYEDSEMAYVKYVPANALPYAEVEEIGGMTYRVDNSLTSAKVTEVVSTEENLFGGDALADVIVANANGIKDPDTGTVRYEAKSSSYALIFGGFLENTRYTIIMYGKNLANSTYANMRIHYADGTYETVHFADAGDNMSYAIIVTKSGKSVRDVRAHYASGTTVLEYGKCGIFKGVLTTDDFVPYICHSIPIPEAVQALDGYGCGINDSLYNYIDFEKKQFVKRVGKVDLGTLSWEKSTETVGGFHTGNIRSVVDYPLSRDVGMLCAKYSFAGSRSASPYYGEDKQLTCFISPSAASVTRELYVVDTEYTDAATFRAAMSGVILVYELASPEVADISDLLHADNLIPVEGGGTIRMVNEHGYDVPSTVVYQLEMR